MSAPRASRAPLAPLTEPDYLPHILQHIFTYLTPGSLATCLRVSHQFQALASSLLYRHLRFEEHHDPFTGLDVYDPQTRERHSRPSETKMALLVLTRSIDVRAHPAEMCNRFGPGGWRLPKFEVLQLHAPMKPKPLRQPNLADTGDFQNMGHSSADPPNRHPRECKLLRDLSPRTLVIFDLSSPSSRTGHPLGIETLPPTINKVVLVLDGSQRTGYFGWFHAAIFEYFPIDAKDVVCMFAPLQNGKPADTISRLVDSIVKMILHEPAKRYTLVNISALQLTEMEGMSPEERQQRFMEPFAKCLEHYVVDRKEVDELLKQVSYLSLDEYVRKGASNEFQPDDIRMLTGNLRPSAEAVV